MNARIHEFDGNGADQIYKEGFALYVRGQFFDPDSVQKISKSLQNVKSKSMAESFDLATTEGVNQDTYIVMVRAVREYYEKFNSRDRI